MVVLHDPSLASVTAAVASEGALGFLERFPCLGMEQREDNLHNRRRVVSKDGLTTRSVRAQAERCSCVPGRMLNTQKLPTNIANHGHSIMEKRAPLRQQQHIDIMNY